MLVDSALIVNYFEVTAPVSMMMRLAGSRGGFMTYPFLKSAIDEGSQDSDNEIDCAQSKDRFLTLDAGNRF
jgi:hypothetical protein